MKIYIAVDMEGIAGVSHWDEVDKDKPDYAEFQDIMTRDVLAAVEGAKKAGASEIWVRDAHWSARNLRIIDFPPYVRIVRGWSGSPTEICEGMDKTFDAFAFIGYHSPAGSNTHPLAHTNTEVLAEIRINGERSSEFLQDAMTVEYLGVPLVFTSGDTETCAIAKSYNPQIETVDVLYGVGNSVISIAPSLSQQRIEAGMKKAVRGLKKFKTPPLPDHFAVEIDYVNPAHAFQSGWYPGARQISERTIAFDSDDYFEVLRFFKFVIPAP